VLAEYIDHYNHDRPHQGIEQRRPCGPADVIPLPTGRVERRDQLAGSSASTAGRRPDEVTEQGVNHTGAYGIVLVYDQTVVGVLRVRFDPSRVQFRADALGNANCTEIRSGGIPGVRIADADIADADIANAVSFSIGSRTYRVRLQSQVRGQDYWINAAFDSG
jgi:hypothetical protein